MKLYIVHVIYTLDDGTDKGFVFAVYKTRVEANRVANRHKNSFVEEKDYLVRAKH